MPGANWTGGGRYNARRQAKDKVAREHFGKQKILSQSMGGGFGRSVNRPDTSSISLAHANTTAAAAVSSFDNFTLPNLGTAKSSKGAARGDNGDGDGKGEKEVGKKKRKSELLDLLDDLDPSTFANKRQKILQVSNLVSLPASSSKPKLKSKASIPPQYHDDHITYADIACAPPSLARSAYSGDDRISDDTTTDYPTHRPRMSGPSRARAHSRSSSSSAKSFVRPSAHTQDNRPQTSHLSRSSDTFSTDETRIASHYGAGSGSFLSYSSPTSKSFGGVSSSSDRAHEYEDSFRAPAPSIAHDEPRASMLDGFNDVDYLGHHIWEGNADASAEADGIRGNHDDPTKRSVFFRQAYRSQRHSPILASSVNPPSHMLDRETQTQHKFASLLAPSLSPIENEFDSREAELPQDDNALLAELYDLPETASLDIRVAHLEKVMARYRQGQHQPSDANPALVDSSFNRATNGPGPISALAGTNSMMGSDALQLSDGQFDELEEKVREDMAFEMGLDMEADEDGDGDEWASWLGTNADGVGMGTGTSYEDEHDEMRNGVVFSHQYGPVHEEEDDAQDYGFPAYLRNDTDVDVGVGEDVDKDFPATSTTTTMAYLNQNHSPTTQPLTRTRARPSTPASNSTSHLLTKKLTPIAEEETSSHFPPPTSSRADTDYVLNFQLQLDLERFNQNQKRNQSPSPSPVSSVLIATPPPVSASDSDLDIGCQRPPSIRIRPEECDIDDARQGLGLGLASHGHAYGVDEGGYGDGDKDAAAAVDGASARLTNLTKRPSTPHPHPASGHEPGLDDQIHVRPSQSKEPDELEATQSTPETTSIISHKNGCLLGPSLFASFGLEDSEEEEDGFGDELGEWGR